MTGQSLPCVADLDVPLQFISGSAQYRESMVRIAVMEAFSIVSTRNFLPGGIT